MANIKNLIFDLGGVILDLDFSRTINAFADLGASDFAGIFNPPGQAELIDLFDKGLISEDAFFTALKTQYQLPHPVAALEQAWLAMLLDMPAHRLAQLKT